MRKAIVRKKALILKRGLLRKTDENPEKCLQIATAGGILGKDKTAESPLEQNGTLQQNEPTVTSSTHEHPSEAIRKK